MSQSLCKEIVVERVTKRKNLEKDRLTQKTIKKRRKRERSIEKEKEA